MRCQRGAEEVLEGGDGPLLVRGGDEEQLAAGVDRRLDGVEELREFGHEVGLVDQRQRARVGAAGFDHFGLPMSMNALAHSSTFTQSCM